MILKGITINLINLKENGEDDFNSPIYIEVRTSVENVLVAPTSSTEVLDILNLTGKKAVYSLAIPKGDKNIWEDQYVEFFGKRFRVIGKCTEGIEKLIPLAWNKKVMVEEYENIPA